MMRNTSLNTEYIGLICIKSKHSLRTTIGQFVVFDFEWFLFTFNQIIRKMSWYHE